MSVWREILIKDIREIESLNFSKLNCIQQDLADKFQNEKLTKIEVFCILQGMINKEMVNIKNAKRYYENNYDSMLINEGIDIYNLPNNGIYEVGER